LDISRRRDVKNRKTTVAGILLLVGAAVTVVGQLLSGQPPDFEALLAALGGVGLLAAGDGGL
jgi:hypothetical protein